MNVGVLFASRFKDPGEFLADARAMEAAGVDSVWIEEGGEGFDPMLMLAAIAAVTDRIRLGFIASPTAEPGAERRRALETLQELSRQRLVPESQRWRRVKAPLHRDAWANMLREAEGQADGVLVAMNPRLSVILRNP